MQTAPPLAAVAGRTPHLDPAIRLSILIPAYNYPAGVDRILKAVCPLPVGVEVIVMDDSASSDVADTVGRFRDANLSYQRNVPAKGAVPNWNSLLDAARGTYVMLCHHDELPLGNDFAARLVSALDRKAPDVLLLDLVLLDASLSHPRRHVPRLYRDAILRYCPGYLFARNLIGPTATIVARRDLYPRFDTRLKWMVDVDAYYRLRQRTKAWRTSRSLVIGSVQGGHRSITQTLQKDLTQIEGVERSLLTASHPEAAIWINLSSKPVIGRGEVLFRALMHSIQWVIDCISPPKGPLA